MDKCLADTVGDVSIFALWLVVGVPLVMVHTDRTQELHKFGPSLLVLACNWHG